MGLYFPSIITTLCGRAGVTWGPNEEVIQPAHAIDRCMMVIVKGWESSVSSSSTSTIPPPPQLQPQRPTTVIARLEHLADEFMQFRTY